MVAVRVKGLNKVRSKGRTYYYHRKSGRRIVSEPGTSEFFAEIADAEASIADAPKAKPGTLGMIIDAYRASKFFTDKRAATRVSYEKALAVLEPLRDMPLAKITSGFAAQLRDRLADKRGRWITNYTLKMLSILMDFARERDAVKENPIKKVRHIPKSADAPQANRPWRPQECRTVLDAAPPYMRVPIALAMLAGFRKSDALTVAKTAIRGDLIEVRTKKRGKDVRIPIHSELAAVLAGAPAHDSVTIAATSRGMPWTSDGFNTSFQKLIRRLEADGMVGEGLTMHGLRHTLATRLKEAGAAEEDIADLLGQSSLAMARHYSKSADTTEKGRSLIHATDVFGNKKRS